MYHSADACCTNLTWARPHLLLFDDDYRVFTLDPTTRAVRAIAGFSEFLVSPDGRWMAGFAGQPPELPETVGVVSLRKPGCLVVPHGTQETDEIAGFTRDSKSVIVGRTDLESSGRPSRLVQFALSALHTACPPSMLAPSKRSTGAVLGNAS